MKMRKGNRRVVSATELAEMGFCEQKIRLKAQYGDRDTRESAQLRSQGKQNHLTHHHTTLHHHNRPDRDHLPVSDRRCFIASAVYGMDDPRTNELRKFRDERLLTFSSGRIAVLLYYRFSPVLAGLAQRHPGVRKVAIVVLDHVRRRIASNHPSAKERTHGKHQQDQFPPPQ